MFEGMGEGFARAFGRLGTKVQVEEADLEHFFADLRRALLEADCDYRLVKEFVARAREKEKEIEAGAAPGAGTGGLTRTQALVRAVLDELTEILGKTAPSWEGQGARPQIVLLVGLNGAGKTTTAAKLVKLMGGPPEKTLLVGGDTRRPAAREQLAHLARAVRAGFFSPAEITDPVRLVEAAHEEVARAAGEGKPYERVILDAAGRQAVDEELLEEIRRVAEVARAHERLLVIDAATGQSALAVAEAFHGRVPLTGVFLSRADSDARGGAVLTLAARLKLPVKAVGTGEKPEAAEVFHPDRMARRILGMGDILSLLDKAGPGTEEDLARAKRAMKGDIDLEDFLVELQKMKKMGGLGSMLSLLPGGGRLAGEADASEGALKRFEAIIRSMTPEERKNHEIIGASRKRRIALGSGTDVTEVGRLLKMVREGQKFLKKGGIEKMLGGFGRA